MAITLISKINHLPLEEAAVLIESLPLAQLKIKYHPMPKLHESISDWLCRSDSTWIGSYIAIDLKFNEIFLISEDEVLPSDIIVPLQKESL